MEFARVIQLIEDCRQLDGLSLADKGSLLMRARARRFKAGEAVFKKGQPNDGVFLFTLSGHWDILGAGDKLIASRGAGEILGEIAQQNPRQERTATIVATGADDPEALEWKISEIEKADRELANRLRSKFEEIGFGRIAESGTMG